jgi:hypothetical protein
MTPPAPGTCEPSRLRRVRYRPDQLLAAGDLRDSGDAESRRRALHVRAVHGVWGIAIGFRVFIEFGGKHLVISPGFAYDCAGREIISSRTVLMEMPEVPAGKSDDSWWFDLVIGYRPSPPACEGPQVACVPGREEERPTWRWVFEGAAGAGAPVPADAVRNGLDLPVARVRVNGLRRVAELDHSVRRIARGQAAPYTAGGRAPANSTYVIGNALHWTVKIDTSAAGFITVPHYLASLADHPFGPASPLASVAGVDVALQLGRLLGPFVSVEDPTRQDFTLRVVFAIPGAPSPPTSFSASDKKVINALAPTLGMLPMAVDWVGVEPVPGKLPQASSNQLYLASGVLWSGLIQFIQALFP